MFKRDGTISAFWNPYIDSLCNLTDRIKEFNAKFIRDISGLRLAKVLTFTLKIVKSAPFEGHGWQCLPEILSKKTTIINIQNNDERCYGYALLYFLERANLSEKHCFIPLFSKKKCFSVTISILFLTQFHPTMSIYTRISCRWTSMCFLFLMTKAALAILWWSAI